ncbi:RAD5-like protein [Biscogniauxia mediterranea]|nr:RAD5-like protein [Biscogniauxia mediterranea]
MPPRSKRPPPEDLDWKDRESSNKVPRRGKKSASRRPQTTAVASNTTTSWSHAQPIQLPPRSTWADPVDDEEDVVELTQDHDNSTSPGIELYGTKDDKIVGVRYYSGLVTPGEAILCRREPRNPYDSNAIRVDNIMGAQIGHLPRNLAMKLAPYIDNDDIVLEGVLNGNKGAWDCPVRLYFYGTSDPVARLALEERLKADKLVKATEMKKTRKEAEAQRAVAKDLNNGSEVGLGSSEHAARQAALQELLEGSEETNFRADLSAIDTFTMDEATLSKFPMAEQPEMIKTKMLPHQLQGLAWLTSKESPQLPPPGSKEVIQLWKRDSRGNFQNLVSGHVAKDRPALLSGGLLCDDMGLGKTLQVISLILTSGFQEGPTLIIAPTGVMSNWAQQIAQHVKEDRVPRILRYHRVPKGEKYAKKDFLKYDVVITSYGKLTSDFAVSDKNGLFSVGWRRVVLDEGHKIRNADTKTAKAACGLQAKSRWVLTGTPIINNVRDFLSALQFLKISGGVEQKTLFSNKIAGPLEDSLKSKGNREERAQARTLLQCLIQDLCLRRKKEMEYIDLKLPKKTEYMHRVTFTEDEQAKYDKLMTQAQGILQAYNQRQPKPKKKTKRKDGDEEITFATVLERLLRLRQMCCHWSLCGSRVKDILAQLDDQEIVKFTPENLQILQEALLEANNNGEECPICYEAINMHTPVITACKHRFGRRCIVQAIGMNDRCPMCRQTLGEEDLVELAPPPSPPDDDDDDNDSNGSARAATAAHDPEKQSSKTDQLEQIVRKHLSGDPKSKMVIFSQWTSFLDVIEGAMREAGYGPACVRLEGRMSPAQRDRAMEALNSDPDTRIMLASLNAASVGVNLVAADTVVLADCWWAPAIEDQAVDRVHRLGQTRPVTVYKLFVEGSVEERVLDIQREKRKLVALAFREDEDGEGDGEGARRRRGRNGNGSGSGSAKRAADVDRLLFT